MPVREARSLLSDPVTRVLHRSLGKVRAVVVAENDTLAVQVAQQGVIVMVPTKVTWETYRVIARVFIKGVHLLGVSISLVNLDHAKR